MDNKSFEEVLADLRLLQFNPLHPHRNNLLLKLYYIAETMFSLPTDIEGSLLDLERIKGRLVKVDLTDEQKALVHTEVLRLIKSLMEVK